MEKDLEPGPLWDWESMRCIVKSKLGRSRRETEEMYQYSLEPGRWHWAWGERRGQMWSYMTWELTSCSEVTRVSGTAVGPMHSPEEEGMSAER